MLKGNSNNFRVWFYYGAHFYSHIGGVGYIWCLERYTLCRYIANAFDKPRFTLHYRTDAPMDIRKRQFDPKNKLSRGFTVQQTFIFCAVANSVADPDHWSGNRCLFNPWIRDPGSLTHIYESLVTFFWVKSSIILWKLAQIFFFCTSKLKYCSILWNLLLHKKVWQQIFFTPLFCFCFWIRDPRSEIQDPRSEIRDPGSGMGKNQDPGSGINIPDPPQQKLRGIQKPNSWTYSFFEVPGHNLESSQTWGFCMDLLNHREGGVVFCQVFFFLLYSVQLCTIETVRGCVSLKK